MKTKEITLTALGVALYVVMGLSLKVPLISHISVDLGYVVFAIYCYHFGSISGAIVGGAGCVLLSLLAYGMFPPGWFIGNILIGLMCGAMYKLVIKNHIYKRQNEIATIGLLWAATIVSVFVGVLFVKTIIECYLFNIPILVKLPKNLIAALTDSLVMCIGILLAPRIPIN